MKLIVNKKIAFRAGITLLVFLITCLAVWDAKEIVGSVRKWSEPFSIVLVLTVVLVLLMGLFWVVIGLTNFWDINSKGTVNSMISRLRESLGWFRWPIVVFCVFTPAITLLYTSLGFRLTGFGFRLAFFIVTVFCFAGLVTGRKDEPVSWRGVFVGILLVGSVFAFGKAFIGVVDHPLSLTWSEGNRIWDYSILYGRDLYNYPEEQPIKAYIDRGRQTLWGLPFLLSKVSITGVRMWSAILFSVPYVFLGWVSFRSINQLKIHRVCLGLWSFLFLIQGPIYTPLVLSAILIVGARKKPIWIALPLIWLAGRYTQISRITWMIAPALWAGLIALLDITDTRKDKLTLKNWGKILAYGLTGILGGFGIKAGWLEIRNYFIKASRNKVDVISQQLQPSVYTDTSDATEVLGTAVNNTAVIDQPFLWERLLPNPTYGLGILLGLLLAVVPVILLLIYLIRSRRWNLNLWQKLGLLGVFGSLLSIGLIISTKIGGGGDLHNLDMFLVSIVIGAGLAWEYGGHELLSKPSSHPVSIRILLLLTLVIPAFTPWINAKPLDLPPEERTKWTMELLQRETDLVLADGGEILFMDQRQLLTFGLLGDIPLVPEYEKKILMDRAMSGNTAFFESFYKDISDHRFDLIVTDPQRIRYSEDDEGWGKENDVWVEWVTKPLLCDYEPVYTLKTTGVWLLVPREMAGDCPYP